MSPNRQEGGVSKALLLCKGGGRTRIANTSAMERTLADYSVQILCRGLGEEQEGWYDEVWVIFFLPCYRFLRFSGCVSIKRHFVGANLGIDRLMAFWCGEVRRLDFVKSSISAVVYKILVSRLFLRFFNVDVRIRFTSFL
jgi:hypothetical protein